jgi:hypothetical protein
MGQVDTLKKDGALKDIRGVLEDYVAAMTARDANGLLAVHVAAVAAVYDRIDALSWFVELKGVSLSDKGWQWTNSASSCRCEQRLYRD